MMAGSNHGVELFAGSGQAKGSRLREQTRGLHQVQRDGREKLRGLWLRVTGKGVQGRERVKM